MKVKFTQEITVSALERRIFIGDVIEVDDSLAGMLLAQGLAVDVTDAPDVSAAEATPELPAEDVAPEEITPRGKRKGTAE